MIAGVVKRMWRWYLRISPWGLIVLTLVLAVGMIPRPLVPPPAGTGPVTRLRLDSSGPSIWFWSASAPSSFEGIRVSLAGRVYSLGTIVVSNVSVETNGAAATATKIGLKLVPFWWAFAMGFGLSALLRLFAESNSGVPIVCAPALWARQRRRLMAGAAVLLVATLVLLAFWIESWRRAEPRAWSPGPGTVVLSGGGHVLVGHSSPTPRTRRMGPGQSWGGSRVMDGIGAVESLDVPIAGPAFVLRGLSIHFGVLLAVVGALWGVWLWRYELFRVMRRRAVRSLCTCCGYDLRATPQRCPECGLETTDAYTARHDG